MWLRARRAARLRGLLLPGLVRLTGHTPCTAKIQAQVKGNIETSWVFVLLTKGRKMPWTLGRTQVWLRITMWSCWTAWFEGLGGETIETKWWQLQLPFCTIWKPEDNCFHGCAGKMQELPGNVRCSLLFQAFRQCSVQSAAENWGRRKWAIEFEQGPVNQACLEERWPYHQRKKHLPKVSFLFPSFRYNSVCVLSKPPS